MVEIGPKKGPTLNLPNPATRRSLDRARLSPILKNIGVEWL
jgi:hypothetical protein